MIGQGTAGGRDAADGSTPPSDDDVVSRKRVRVARACDACRRRKERCDGTQPSCHRCSSIGRPCSYNPYRKRGLRTGYVKGTEILLGLLIYAYDGAEDLILSVLNNKAAGHISSQTGHSTAPAPTSLLETWHNSTALQDLQKVLAVSESEDDEESCLQDLDSKLTLAFNALPRQETQANVDLPANSTPQEHLPPPISPPSPPLISSLSPTAYLSVQTENPTPTCTGPWGPTIPRNWSQLVQIYLTNTHSWLPIIQKYTLFRSANLLAGNAVTITTPRSLEQPHPGEVASLWATLSLSSYELEAARKAGRVPAPTSEHDPGELRPGQIYSVARDLALRDLVCFDAGHVHAFLVLALVEIGHGSWVKAWLWVGRAVYTATNLGIVPRINGRLAEPLDDTKKQLFLGCFILDNLLAVRLSHRPYLNSADLRHVGVITFDGLEEWETWSPVFGEPAPAPGAGQPAGPSRILSTFDRLGNLVGLLSRIHLRQSETISQQELRQTAGEFSTICQSGPTVGAGILCQEVAPQARETEPPHFLQCKLMAAVTYVRIQLEIARCPTELPPYFLDTLEKAVRPDIIEALSLLKSTPRHSSLSIHEWSPPPLRVALDLLDQIGASSPDCYLRSGLAEPRKQTELIPAVTAAVQPDDVPQTMLPPAQPLGEGRNAELGRNLSAAAPAATAVAHLQEPVDDGPLFNQLTLLDTADWSAGSADFMEHLGLSRDGPSFDFDGLFS